jgi:hypothetical protein
MALVRNRRAHGLGLPSGREVPAQGELELTVDEQASLQSEPCSSWVRLGWLVLVSLEPSAPELELTEPPAVEEQPAEAAAEASTVEVGQADTEPPAVEKRGRRGR